MVPFLLILDRELNVYFVRQCVIFQKHVHPFFGRSMHINLHLIINTEGLNAFRNDLYFKVFLLLEGN